jgi:hypothetical protein
MKYELAEHVACMGGNITAYNIFVGKLKKIVTWKV